ncbi:MAG TPA: FtsW/RodA/SpoVE family cell cycle protein [Patescibacteria group bacterium]|nr:FtsW/RodA/SpoVE family cell cycle protein [Patescibacteria group bacterium]
MTGLSAGAGMPALPGFPRPRARPREFALLGAVVGAVAIGSLSLGLLRTGRLEPADPEGLALFAAGLLAAHLLLVVSGRRLDEVLLPAAALLGGIGLLVMERLPQDLVVREIGPWTLDLAGLQLLWLGIALAVAASIAVGFRSDRWLRLYKYTWAAAGLTLLALTFVFGTEINGSRLTLQVGPVSGQPSELLKVILVVFFAGYLAENRVILADARVRLVGPVSVPPLPYLAPIAAMLALALGIVVIQGDLGAALLFYAVFLALFFVATGRLTDVALGLVLFGVGFLALAALFPHVQERIAIWLDPWSDPLGSGYQLIHALHAFARGGLVGTGLGAGLPEIAGRPPIPAVHTDFPLAAIGEELGLTGVLAVLAAYLVLVERGLRIAASSRDDFRALLAAGLALVIGVQAAIIAAGNLKLIPLTGITLPLVSYGGSSLLANAIVIGMLLALSDRGAAPLAPPRPSRLARLRRRPGGTS